MVSIWLAAEEPATISDFRFTVFQNILFSPFHKQFLSFPLLLFIFCRHRLSIFKVFSVQYKKNSIIIIIIFVFRFWLRFLFHWIGFICWGPWIWCFLSSTKQLSYSFNSVHMSGPLDRFARPCEYQYLHFLDFSYLYGFTYLMFWSISTNPLELRLNSAEFNLVLIQ